MLNRQVLWITVLLLALLAGCGRDADWDFFLEMFYRNAVMGEYDGSLIRNCSEIGSRGGCFGSSPDERVCDEFRECLERNYSLIDAINMPKYDKWVEELKSDRMNTPGYHKLVEEHISGGRARVNVVNQRSILHRYLIIPLRR